MTSDTTKMPVQKEKTFYTLQNIDKNYMYFLKILQLLNLQVVHKREAWGIYAAI